jgi:hypothetical protein
MSNQKPLPKWAIEFLKQYGNLQFGKHVEIGIRAVLHRVDATEKNDPKPPHYDEYAQEFVRNIADARASLRKEIRGE